MTYPNFEVQQFLREHFTPLRINTQQESDPVRCYNVNWTPTLLVLNEQGVEEHRVVGYLPPEDMRAELRLGLAKGYIDRNEWENAIIHLQEAVAHFPDTWTAPEAQYWLGVARYRLEGKPDGLLSEWNVLLDRWPQSRWAHSAGFIRE